MDNRTVYLLRYRSASSQRAHFAIFVPHEADRDVGTIIHAVGAPMVGYHFEFKRNYSPKLDIRSYDSVEIGQVNVKYVKDSAPGNESIDSTPRCNLESVASQVPSPRVSQNFMAPVNDTNNKRCQEWTMDYVRRLVDLGYIAQDAVNIVQSKRDPPYHGIGLQSIAINHGHCT